MPRSFEPQSSHESELELLDLTCPSCGSDLIGDTLFLSHRTCGTCKRHFSIGARERVNLLVDGARFEEIPDAGAGSEPVLNDQYPSAERIAEHQHLQVIADAVVTGTGRIGGVGAVVVALDDHLVGAGLGALMSGKIIAALDHARARRMPVVVLCAGGASSANAGPLSLVQGRRLAGAFAQVHMEGMPVIGVLSHPVAGNLFALLAAHCDIVFSEPGVQIGSGTSGNNVPDASRLHPVDRLRDEGWIDAVVERSSLRDQVGRFLDLACNPGLVRAGAASGAADGAAIAAGDALANLGQPGRPRGADFLKAHISGYVPLRGDRIDGDDVAVECGLGRIESLSIAIVVQSPSAGSPAIAARKVARLARLAGRLELPLVLLVEGETASEDESFSPSMTYAVAGLGALLSLLPTPVVSVGMGRIAGELASSLMAGDRQYMMASAVQATRSDDVPGLGAFPAPPRPMRAATQPWRGRGVLTARECERLGLVDGVIPEPPGGAHEDPARALAAARATILAALGDLTGTGQRRLLDARQRRQRHLGQSTPEGMAAARIELWELHEWQRNVGRSIDDWRLRWEQLKASQPRLSFQRPDMTDLASRLRARRAELIERARIGDRASD